MGNNKDNVFRWLDSDDIRSFLDDEECEYTSAPLKDGRGVQFKVRVKNGIATLTAYDTPLRPSVVLGGASSKELRARLIAMQNEKLTGKKKGLLG